MLIFTLFKGGIASGRRLSELAGLVDIVPTVLALLGIEPPAQVQGRDLFGETEPDADPAYYCETLLPTVYQCNPLLGIVTQKWKYIQSTRSELYDLASDPSEEKNLIATDPHRGRIMQDRLQRMLENSVATAAGDSRMVLDAQL